ncbi:MAG: DUF434 domain-containing protein [Deltaproteobacteria bacterium]|nr:DUF434 domain-containing protein [Deltaproteobacteria bacterium]
MPQAAPSPDLDLAAQELRFLLARGYPREKCLVLVGDCHALLARDRDILRRAVLAPERAAQRRTKLLEPSALAGRPVGLDGHNVLITLESALAGRILVRGDDGVIRDIARAAKSFKISALTDRALELILHTLKNLEAAEAFFYLDQPVSFSGRLAHKIKGEMAGLGLAGTALAVPLPERQLRPFEGPVASSDGELIEACSEPIDLAGLIIGQKMREAPVIELST